MTCTFFPPKLLAGDDKMLMTWLEKARCIRFVLVPLRKRSKVMWACRNTMAYITAWRAYVIPAPFSGVVGHVVCFPSGIRTQESRASPPQGWFSYERGRVWIGGFGI